VGGPSEPALRSNHDSSSAGDLERAILARLDKIASVLQNLLEVSHELLERVEELKEAEIPRSKVVEEEGIAENLPEGIDVSTLLDLPDHLRKPLMAIFKLGGRGTAVQVSEKLGISRPQASSTLNSLVRLRLLSKKREGKEGRRGADAIFMVPEKKN
jgi:Fic family protein